MNKRTNEGRKKKEERRKGKIRNSQYISSTGKRENYFR